MEWSEVSIIDIESKAECRANLFSRMGFEKKAEFCAISCSRCTFGGRLHLREKEMIGSKVPFSLPLSAAPLPIEAHLSRKIRSTKAVRGV